MNFKVGQRVRITRPGVPASEKPAGSEGVVIGTAEHTGSIFQHGTAPFYLVDVKGIPAGFGGGWVVSHEDLSPILDEKADAFLETVRRWKPEPVIPLPVKIASYSGWKVKS